MALASNIKPISYLKSHAAEIVRTLGESTEPYIITQNGQAKVVVQDINSYERMRETIALLKIIAQGKEEIESGKMQDAADVLANLRSRR